MTNRADLIAALRIPMNVTIRDGAPELDEYDEQRKAAADALEAVWAEATAAAYGAAKKTCSNRESFENGSREDVAVGAYLCGSYIDRLTPQSARDWLAAHDAEVYRRGQEDMRERAAEVAYYQYWSAYDASDLRADICAIPIKEKDDE